MGCRGFSHHCGFSTLYPVSQYYFCFLCLFRAYFHGSVVAERTSEPISNKVVSERGSVKEMDDVGEWEAACAEEGSLGVLLLENPTCGR